MLTGTGIDLYQRTVSYYINLSMLSYLSFHFRLRNQERLSDLPKAREYIRIEFLPFIFASLDINISLNLKFLTQKDFETAISSNTIQ